MRALAAFLLAGLALASVTVPLAEAQTVINPICSPPAGASKRDYCTYEQQYLVMGRVLDANGQPAKGARVVVTIDQAGTVDAQGNKPMREGVANCKGDFEFSFAGLRSIVSSGRVHVTVKGVDGHADETTSAALEPFWRRNDVLARVPYGWNYACEQLDPPFDLQISVKGRLLNRTEPYEANGATFHARPYTGVVGLYWWNTEGQWFCPPNGRGGCEPIYTDELGNFKYTWTFQEPLAPDGVVEVVTFDGASFNATVDPTSRLAVHRVEVSGQGPPATDDVPAPALALALGTLALVAALRRRRA